MDSYSFASWRTPQSTHTLAKRSPTASSFFASAGAASTYAETQAITALTNALNRLEALEQKARHRQREVDLESHKKNLMKEVGKEALELNRLRDRLAEVQHRKAVAEERIAAIQLLQQVRQCVEDALICGGRAPLLQHE